jgi:hypothetical protein
MRDTRTLWAAAAQLYDEPGNGLQASSRVAARRGFRGGAAWMRSAMSVVRGSAPLGDARFAQLGFCKYTLATLAALLVLAALWRQPMLAVPAAIFAFYLVEARMVFVFPLALDGEVCPFRTSHQLLRRTLPPIVATARVMSIAARMLLGGFVGRGFVRSWCVGCLAVVLWYEDARETSLVPA